MRIAGLLGDIGRDFRKGFTNAYGVGGEDTRRAMHRARELQGKTAEGPKMDLMAGSYPLAEDTRAHRSGRP